MSEAREILVVEDDSDIQESLKTFLELEGFRVSSAMNGREALDYLAKGHSPCLILLDLMMPVMTGYQFLDAVNSPSPTKVPPIIIFSAASDVETTAKSRSVPYIKKPISLEMLLDVIQKYCGS